MKYLTLMVALRNQKDERLCHLYIQHNRNATQTAKHSDYSYTHAFYKLKSDPLVARINELDTFYQARNMASPDRVYEELSAISFTNAKDILTMENGKIIVKDLAMLSPMASKAIKDIKISEVVVEQKNGSIVTTRVVSLSMYDKLAALKELSRCMDMSYKPTVPIEEEGQVRGLTVIGPGKGNGKGT